MRTQRGIEAIVQRGRELAHVVVARLVRNAEPRVDVQRVGEVDHDLDRYAGGRCVGHVADVRAIGPLDDRRAVGRAPVDEAEQRERRDLGEEDGVERLVGVHRLGAGPEKAEVAHRVAGARAIDRDPEAAAGVDDVDRDPVRCRLGDRDIAERKADRAVAVPEHDVAARREVAARPGDGIQRMLARRERGRIAVGSERGKGLAPGAVVLARDPAHAALHHVGEGKLRRVVGDAGEIHADISRAGGNPRRAAHRQRP